MPGQVFLFDILFLVRFNAYEIQYGNLMLVIVIQWEYQVGPSVGIEAGDDIWCSRYILEVIHSHLFLCI